MRLDVSIIKEINFLSEDEKPNRVEVADFFRRLIGLQKLFLAEGGSY
jgi:hypothetical protein